MGAVLGQGCGSFRQGTHSSGGANRKKWEPVSTSRPQSGGCCLFNQGGLSRRMGKKGKNGILKGKEVGKK